MRLDWTADRSSGPSDAHQVIVDGVFLAVVLALYTVVHVIVEVLRAVMRKGKQS